MFILGTAGHVDHGKSALVRALTGIDPDRLPEEKRRGMTIDLGFAWLPISSGEVVGVVDVPGHKDLIKNMVAGAWGIDAALLVIAADDGWMPQTEEHLQILNLLGIECGIVALTKIDLIDDLRWLNLVEEDIKGRLKASKLSSAHIVRVSAKEGTNIPALRKNIEELIPTISPRKDIGKPYMPIDRVFTIKGSGTVLTGTLIDGSLSRGMDVTIFPKNLHSRIRALESYKQKMDKAQPGTRVAINLIGLEKEVLKRGDVVFGNEDQIRGSKIIDTRVELVSQPTSSLNSDAELVVYIGTKETWGRLILFDRESLGPGESAFAQLRFKEQVATRIGDRFIIRKPSAAETIGGGIILDPLANKHKVKDIGKTIVSLQKRLGLHIEELILSELDKHKHVKVEEVLIASHYSAAESTSCIKLLQNKNKLIAFDSWAVDSTYWQRKNEQAVDILAHEHSVHPLDKGLPQAELYNRLDLPRGLFNRLIENLVISGKITCDNKDIIALAAYKPTLSAKQESIASEILETFKRNQTNPPTKRELAIQIPGSEEIVGFMCQQDILIELPDDVLFECRNYEIVKNEIINFLKNNGTVSIQQIREIFGFSRKHILPLLHKLDQEGITKRLGDNRVLAKR